MREIFELGKKKEGLRDAKKRWAQKTGHPFVGNRIGKR